MTYHRITDEDRNDLIGWLNSKGYDGLPGPRNWLRSQVADWAEATGVPYADDEGIPYDYDQCEQLAYQAMVADAYGGLQ